MWREIARQAFDEADFRSPGDGESIAEGERRLGHRLPSALVDLLGETDGVVGEYGVQAVWSLERIVEDNLHFRSYSAFVDLYMPFDPLVFFGDNGVGDQFAFVRTPPRADVFLWQHEDDSRRWVARDLEDYLRRSLHGDDWYQ